MTKSIIISEEVKHCFSARTTLAGIGVKVRHLALFEPIHQQVQIAQKVVKYKPSEKLLDGYIAILAGAHGLVEINKRVRSDRGLQIAFGRTGCAEQSVVQDTLDACTTENVAQMQQVMNSIYRQHSQGYRHDYQTDLAVVGCGYDWAPLRQEGGFCQPGLLCQATQPPGAAGGLCPGNQV